MYGVIDIGSNSVRLMISDGKNTLSKQIRVTRLAEGIADTKCLLNTACERTATAVCNFVRLSNELGVKDIFIFATAAVRQAKNPQLLTDKIKTLTNIDVDIVSGEQEAILGAMGAIRNGKGGIIDVGGGSAEITVMNDFKIIYAKSLDTGSVKLTDSFGQKAKLVKDYLLSRMSEYGQVPNAEFYAIGGTATSLAAIIQELSPYDPEKVDGFCLKIDEMEKIIDRLTELSIEEKRQLKGLQPERAEVILSGSILLYEIMKYLRIERVFVSEKDNLEGYLKLKTERI